MFGRGQGLNYGGIPKLLAPEISLGGNFSYDKNGRFFTFYNDKTLDTGSASKDLQFSVRLVKSN